MSSGPLSHLRVLDFTQRLAGPYGSQMLGDLGADVIKLEPPGADPSHHTPPYYVGAESTYFLSFNRNKRSIIVDLKKPGAGEIARRLVSKCDALIENNRPGIMARLGLGYDQLKAEFPGLVYCSISGFGQDGPDAQRGALDPIAQAMSGVMSLTGERDGKSVRAGVPIGDICAGMYASTAILAALMRRDRTGAGEFIDISMLDVQVAMVGYQASAYLNSGTVPGLQGRAHDSFALSTCVSAADGVDVMIAANGQKPFEVLAKLIGRADLIEDARFKTPQDRNRNKVALRELIDAGCRTVPSRDIVACLHSVGAPASVINSIDRAFAEPQVLHRNMLLEMAGKRPEDRARVAGDPMKLREGGRTAHRYPPHAGEHTREVLAELCGYDAAAIDEFFAAGVVLEAAVADKALEF